MEGELSQIAEQYGWFVASGVALIAGAGTYFIKNPSLFRRAAREDDPTSPPVDRVADLAARVTVIENDLKHAEKTMVTRDEFHKMSLDMTRLTTEMQNIHSTTTATRAAVERTQSILFDIARGQ